jgi:hypothetical protein
VLLAFINRGEFAASNRMSDSGTRAGTRLYLFAVIGASSFQRPGRAKTLLRSGGRWGPKEPDPDTPPLGRVLFSACGKPFVSY